MPGIASKLQRKLKKGDTAERCGLILKDGSVIELENKHPRPELGVLLPAEALIEHEDQLAGTWHTHPVSTSFLSQEDYKGFSQWPSLKHYIVADEGVRCYHIEDELVMEDSFAAR